MQLTRYLRDLPILKKLLAINLAPALAFRDPVSAQQILRSLQAEANVIHARVNTQEGERYAKYATSAILRLREDEAEAAACGRCPASEPVADHLHVCENILLDDELLGTWIIGAGSGPLEARLRFDLLVFSGTLLAALAYGLARARAQQPPGTA